MHDLSKRDTPTTQRSRGIAFDLADLTLIKRWADARAIRMAIRLDYGMEGEDFEEVIGFYPETSYICPLIMWRTAKFVFVLPLVGSARRYRTVARALEGSVMAMLPGTVLTDIVIPKTP
jgi:hypothetical protein